MSKIAWGKGLLTLVAVVTAFGGWLADYGATHMFNDRWPPHAKFHNAQTLLFGTLLGLLAAWFTWRRSGDPRENLLFASILASLYWITQAGAGLLPNTALVDPEFITASTPRLFGMTGPQPVIDVALLALVVGGYVLERRRLRAA
jgi:hypothetical protein